MSLYPSRQQWQRWSLPSKLTAIGALLGAISLGLYGLDKAFQLRNLFVSDTSSSSKGIEIKAPVQVPVIITQGQTGGQVAQTINNFGPPKRVIPAEMRAKMLAVLKSTAPSCAAFASTQGDAEAYEFKGLLIDTFREAGWDVRDMETFMFLGSKKGLVITIPFGSKETGTPQVVAQALAHTGNPISGNRGDMANDCGVYVQVWNAP